MPSRVLKCFCKIEVVIVASFFVFEIAIMGRCKEMLLEENQGCRVPRPFISLMSVILVLLVNTIVRKVMGKNLRVAYSIFFYMAM